MSQALGGKRWISYRINRVKQKVYTEMQGTQGEKVRRQWRNHAQCRLSVQIPIFSLPCPSQTWNRNHLYLSLLIRRITLHVLLLSCKYDMSLSPTELFLVIAVWGFSNAFCAAVRPFSTDHQGSARILRGITKLSFKIIVPIILMTMRMNWVVFWQPCQHWPFASINANEHFMACNKCVERWLVSLSILSCTLIPLAFLLCESFVGSSSFARVWPECKQLIPASYMSVHNKC